jgi:hypothetical protein
MNDDEKMKMLFDEHHRHLSEIRLKIQRLTQGTITLLAFTAGLLISREKILTPWHLFILTIAFLVIAITSIFALYRFNKNYREEASIITKINKYFKFFCIGHFVEKDSIYPRRWEKFGTEPNWRGLEHHIIAIFVMTLLNIGTCFYEVMR